ncbi:hypothetical protein BC833DRAFT_78280 [Globomyces pollinis-pini]|nr:hypothetical protein BC833DRAFT_78280 [Globomyces pollinis-pini]
MELQLQALADLLVDMNIPVKPIQPSNNSQHNELDAKSHRAIWETPITSRTFNNDFASDLLDETIIDYQDNTSPLEYPDSPTFDDLGLSSLSMDLLGNVEMTKPIKDKNLTATTFSDIQNKSERGYSSDFQPPSLRKYTSHLPDRYHSDRESIDSLTPPTLKNDTYIDTNNSCQSIFNQALTLSTESEYQSLDLGVTTQITKKYLDDVIQDINDLVTDKRFLVEGHDENVELFTLNELQSSTLLSESKLKAVLVALLHLRKIESVKKVGLEKYYRICK